MLIGLAFMFATMGMMAGSGGRGNDSAFFLGMAPYFIGIIATLIQALRNLILFCRTGQTWGKQRMGIKVVTQEGAPMSVGGLVWRSFCPTVLGMIPFINILGSFDVFFIFGSARRCLHDYLAGSIVVDADSLYYKEDGVGLNPSSDLGFQRF